MSTHHSYQTRSSNPKSIVIVRRTQLKPKRILAISPSLQQQQQTTSTTTVFRHQPSSIVQTRRIIRRPQTPTAATTTHRLQVTVPQTQQQQRSRSAQESTKLAMSRSEDATQKRAMGGATKSNAPPSKSPSQIRSPTAATASDKTDDNIVATTNTMILPETKTVPPPAPISFQQKSCGDDAINNKNTEIDFGPEAKTAAQNSPNLVSAVSDRRLLAKKIEQVPPIFIVQEDQQAPVGGEEEKVIVVPEKCSTPQASSPQATKRSSPPIESDSASSSSDTSPVAKKSREQSVEAEAVHEERCESLQQNTQSTLDFQLSQTSKIFGGTLSFHCDTCKLEFESAKMLQQHNQSYHADKNYVCEICSKAFRFRSNLAEHRSVHTALKPFVCKFCGKSSRLKGNLTKHILKHHKSEQLDYIGTDEIIIKKGKKSVKDPMAIEFLEKSMIVMTPTQAQSPSLFNHTLNGGNSSRHSTSNLSASDDSMTPLNAGKTENPFDERGFLMSLGLDAGSLDLKAESSESDSSVVGGSSTTNDQLLEKCNLFMNSTTQSQQQTHLDTNTNEHQNEEDEDTEMNDEEVDTSTTTAPPPLMSSAAASALLYNALTQMQQKQNGQAKSSGSGGWAAAMKGQKSNGSFLDGLAANLLDNQKQTTPQRAQQSSSLLDSASSKATTCPKCGKHVRKPRDLITHMVTIHGMAPSAAASSTTQQTHHHSFNGNGASNDQGSQGVQADLRQLLQLVLEMKSASNGNNVGLHKVEQLVANIDSRVGRLEKQLEMALNSIYTLVQLQTGINSQLSRFREDTNEQLKNIVQQIIGEKNADQLISSANNDQEIVEEENNVKED